MPCSNPPGHIFRIEDSIKQEIKEITNKIGLAEEFDHEIYTQSEVLDNLEQTLEGQTFPWDLSGSGEGCTLMVSRKKLFIRQYENIITLLSWNSIMS